MGEDKYVRLDILADDRYQVKIGTDDCYVQHTLATEAHALHWIVKHAEPFMKTQYNSKRLAHVFNNALQHIWHDMMEGEQYPLTRCADIIRDTTPYQLSLFPEHLVPVTPKPADYNNVIEYKDLGGRTDKLKDDMEYHSPGITQVQKDVNWQEADTLDSLLEE